MLHSRTSSHHGTNPPFQCCLSPFSSDTSQMETQNLCLRQPILPPSQEYTRAVLLDSAPTHVFFSWSSPQISQAVTPALNSHSLPRKPECTALCCHWQLTPLCFLLCDFLKDKNLFASFLHAVWLTAGTEPTSVWLNKEIPIEEKANFQQKLF